MSDSYLWAPCCNGWYHRNCVESLAKSTGYFFKCALCNNKEVFENEMKKFGVYVPERVRYTLLRFPDIYTGALKFTCYILLHRASVQFLKYGLFTYFAVWRHMPLVRFLLLGWHIQQDDRLSHSRGRTVIILPRNFNTSFSRPSFFCILTHIYATKSKMGGVLDI